VVVGFLIVWLYVGSTCVFGFYNYTLSEHCHDNYKHVCECHQVPLLFSLVLLIILYVFGVLSFLVWCCCYICWTKQEKTMTSEETELSVRSTNFEENN